MSLYNSTRVQKCQHHNANERQRFQILMDEIEQSEVYSLQGIDKQRTFLKQELHFNRCEGMQNSVTKALRLKEDIVPKRTDPLLHSAHSPRRFDVFTRSKGFTKVDINDDEEDDYLFHGNAAKRKADTMTTRFHRSATMPVMRSKDSEVYIHYPTEENVATTGGIISIEMLNNKKNTEHQRRDLTRKFMFDTHLPRYVGMLKSIHARDFDQYTDGAMNLEERKILQKQRETIPHLVGHLPARKRQQKSANRDRLLFNSQPDKIKLRLRFPDLAARAVPSKNIRVYKPKDRMMDTSNKGSKQQERLQKLKLENEARYYQAAIERTNSFLGFETYTARLVHRQRLNEEENAMLDYLKSSSTFFSEHGSNESTSSTS